MALGSGLVAHIEGQYERHAQFHELDRKVQVPFEVRGVDNVHDHIGLFVDEKISCYQFLGGIGRQAVCPGQIDDLHFHIAIPTIAFFALDRDAGIIPYVLSGAGEFIEYSCLPRIGVACKGNDDLWFHGFFILLFIWYSV